MDYKTLQVLIPAYIFDFFFTRGVNTPTTADIKLIMEHHWTQSGKRSTPCLLWTSISWLWHAIAYRSFNSSNFSTHISFFAVLLLQRFSKCAPQRASSGSLGNLLERQILVPDLRLTELDTLYVEPAKFEQPFQLMPMHAQIPPNSGSLFLHLLPHILFLQILFI